MLTGGHPDGVAGWLYVAAEAGLAVAALAGNGPVVLAVGLDRRLQSPTHFFVASLAAADAAVGALAIPFAVAISAGFCAPFRACLFAACCVLALTQSSIFSLLAIAVDRAVAIRMPLRCNALVTNSRAKAAILVCWALAFAIGLTPMLGWHRKTPPEDRKWPPGTANATFFPYRAANCSAAGAVPCVFEGVVTMEYMVYYNFLACVLLPLLLITALYLRIFMAARRQMRRIKMAAGGRRHLFLQKEIRAAKSLAAIVGLFAVCWLPLHAANCYTFFCAGCARLPPPVMYAAILLSHANSVVNPFLYAYRIREFREVLRNLATQRRKYGEYGMGFRGDELREKDGVADFTVAAAS